jgi:hypothetical protein
MEITQIIASGGSLDSEYHALPRYTLDHPHAGGSSNVS